ncbi:MAG: ribosome small subunit-dependent GTPase A [Chloroflexota bacterium]
MSELIEGLIIKAQSGFFTVHTEEGDFTCRLRGRLKEEWRDTDLVAVGDQVLISRVEDGGRIEGMIEEIQERERALARLAPSAGRGSRHWTRRGYLSEREQVIIANPDHVVFVFACAQPEPRLRMLDRLLVGAELQDIPAIVCANKVDLVGQEEAHELFDIYDEVGYRVVYTSAKTGAGVDELHGLLVGRISALIGPSGAGKTSLLNRMQPGLGLRVREVSRATRKGRHTTVVPQLVPLDGGSRAGPTDEDSGRPSARPPGDNDPTTEQGWVADTPGLKALALFDMDPEEVDAYFPDIAPLVANCRFSDCSHTVEPGCAVKHALEEREVSEHRYESYVRLREEHQKLADMYWWGIDEE